MCIKPISLGRNADTDDAANRLISQVMPPLQSGSGARVLSYLYRYDDLLHQKVGPRGTETLTWDGADQLFWQRSQDGLFQLVVNGNSSSTYDANGCTTLVQPLAGAPTSYPWNPARAGLVIE